MPTEDAYSSGHLVLSHFGTCMCSNVETNLSWTCLVSGLLNFEHPSVLLFCLVEVSIEFQLLGECHCWWTSESPRAHVAKFYGRLRLIRSVWRASNFSVFKIDRNCNFVGLLHHPFWLQLILAPFGHYFFNFLNYIVWLRITDEGSVPEMRIWSISLI